MPSDIRCLLKTSTSENRSNNYLVGECKLAKKCLKLSELSRNKKILNLHVNFVVYLRIITLGSSSCSIIWSYLSWLNSFCFRLHKLLTFIKLTANNVKKSQKESWSLDSYDRCLDFRKVGFQTHTYFQ